MIQVHGICLSFGAQKIFSDLSFSVDQPQRVGLVGRNGSGKSTLLKALGDPSILDDGSISIVRGKRVAYMPQDVVLTSDKSIVAETFTAFEAIYALQQKLTHLEQTLATQPTAELVTAYAQAQDELTALNPEKALAQTKKILMGLGFTAEQLDKPVDILSVGWKMRIVLAKLLLQQADFYLFDEPTNHLDIVAKEWFLRFLQESDAGFMLVCHERYFLDELCTDILEMERGNGTMYKGNYSTYVIQKEEALTRLQSSYELQQKDIQRRKETIERFKAKASKAKMAQSMMKALDKIELITLPPSLKNVNFNFPPVQQAGRTVLTVHNVAHAFEGKQLFQQVSCEIERGQKVALIAPNGVGKTTLFNLIAQALPLQQGNITFGYNVMHAIFAQDQNKALKRDTSILDNIKRLCPKATEQTIRTFLGSFLFSSDDVHKKTAVLSGGEKNRVGMVSVLLQQANLLLLDEPTNHLDIPSKEILLKALQKFDGTIIFVSHDRDFVNDLATHIIELTPQGLHYYHGNYDAYTYQKQHNTSVSTTTASKSNNQATENTTKSGAEQFDLNKKSRRLEATIAKTEVQISTISEQFADLDYGTPDYFAAQKQLDAAQKQLKELEEQWEETQRQISN